MKRILKWLSLLFAVGIAVFVIYLLYTINREEPIETLEPFSLPAQKKEQTNKAFWLNHLAGTKKKGYYFPVNEVYIRTDLVTYAPSQKPFELVVNDLDPYQIFCLREELKRHNVRYFFKKSKEETKLLVYSKSLKKLNDLIKVLKKYQIDAKIQKR